MSGAVLVAAAIVAVNPYVLWNGLTVFASDSISTPGVAQAGMQFNTDGSCTLIGSLGTNPNWYTPTTGSIGNSHWVRATVLTGSITSGTTGSWLQLSSARSWSRLTGTLGVSGATVLIEIATDSGGTNIVSTGTLNITTTVLP